MGTIAEREQLAPETPLRLSDFKFETWYRHLTDREQDETGLVGSLCFKWLSEDGPVATVTVEHWVDNWGSCSNLEVFEPYRGKGLSHQVVEFVKDIGVNNLSVHPENSIAISLYKKHGFYFTGERDGEYLRMRLPKEKTDDN